MVKPQPSIPLLTDFSHGGSSYFAEPLPESGRRWSPQGCMVGDHSLAVRGRCRQVGVWKAMFHHCDIVESCHYADWVTLARLLRVSVQWLSYLASNGWSPDFQPSAESPLMSGLVRTATVPGSAPVSTSFCRWVLSVGQRCVVGDIFCQRLCWVLSLWWLSYSKSPIVLEPMT
jgi:hypothetical protein